MKMNVKFVLLTLSAAIVVVVVNAASIQFKSPNADDAQYWESYNENRIRKLLNRLKTQPVKAKNVILFIGDGMGIQTVTAGRIFKGQHLKGFSGEEEELVWDVFPHTGFSKTYNTDKQVPDSAGTATALFTGVKTKYGVVGIDSTVNKTNMFDGQVHSFIKWAQAAGKRTGIVTTTRITHATPASTFAHVPHRDYESDAPIPKEYRDNIKDIARQLVEDEPGNKLNVILGGGRDAMGDSVKNEQAPPYNFTGSMENSYPRSDGRNLPAEWLKQKNNTKNSFYVKNLSELNKIDTANTEYLLGLFANSHMTYDALRNYTDEPSLAEMTVKALELLTRNNSEGYVLMVEGGKIDHAHHQNFAKLAMYEVLALENAVQAALERVGDDTMIIVTADHSHSVTFSGYPGRGNDILGFGNKGDVPPYETISYANGPGFYEHRSNATNARYGTWTNVEIMDRSSPVYRNLATFPLTDETHGGEDVPVYAKGPNANLVTGAFEQNFIAYIISYSGCFGPGKKYNKACFKYEASSALNLNNSPLLLLTVLCISFLSKLI